MCVGWLRAVVRLSFATVSVKFSLALTQKGCFSKTDNDGTNTKLGLSVTWWGMTMDTRTSQLKESTFGQGAASLCINPYFLYVTQFLSQFFPLHFPIWIIEDILLPFLSASLWLLWWVSIFSLMLIRGHPNRYRTSSFCALHFSMDDTEDKPLQQTKTRNPLGFTSSQESLPSSCHSLAVTERPRSSSKI